MAVKIAVTWALTVFVVACQIASAREQSGHIEINKGSGSFSIEGGNGKEDKIIRVYYHKPGSFSSNSPILIVVPGAGRNGDDYRDAWISASEQYGVLVLSPAYSETDYDLAAYNYGGTIKNLELHNLRVDEDTRIYRIKDEDIILDNDNDPGHWLFSDFDRLFEIAANSVGSSQTGYDMFGHSAGGQIVHRLAIFYPASRAKHLLASNSGYYTLPRFDISPPFGIRGTLVTVRSLKKSFKINLVLFLGELDNEHETRGIALHTPFVDQQGLGRLERGRSFYYESRNAAARLKAMYNWHIEVTPGVGHDYRKMSQAAARYLYGE